MFTYIYNVFTEGELRQINESLAVAVGGVVSQGLNHVMGLEPSFFHSLLHHLHSLHTGQGVKVAVDSNNLGTLTEDHTRRNHVELK